MQKKYYKSLVTGISTLCSVFFTNISTVLAAKPSLDSAKDFTKTVATGAGVVQKTSISQVIGAALRGGFTAVGLVFFALIFYGGINWMTAQGSEEKIAKSKKMVIAATIGLSIVLMAYAITELASRFLR